MGQSLSTEIQTLTVTISWSLTSMPRTFNKKRMVSKKMVLGQLDIHVQK